MNRRRFLAMLGGAELEDLYVNKGMTIQEIANFYGVGRSSIQRRLKKHNIKTRHGGRRIKSIPKMALKTMYVDYGMSLRAIGDFYGVCQDVIRKKLIELNIPRRDPGLKGPKSHMWNGGMFKNPKGYVFVYAPGHPSSKSSGGRYVKRAVMIAVAALGRPLRNREAVHHINGIKDDDRNCNLLICTNSYHAWLHHKMRRVGWRPTPEMMP